MAVARESGVETLEELPRLMHLTTVHKRTDTRILVKECATLAAAFPQSLTLIVADGLGRGTYHGVRVIDVGPSDGRLSRFVVGLTRSVAVLRGMRPAILHIQDPELIVVGFIAKTLGIKVIYDIHEDVPQQILQKTWILPILRRPVAAFVNLAERLAAHWFDALVSATPKIGERFPRSKTVVVQNFPLRSEAIAGEPTPCKRQPATFIYAGIISRLRGAIEMVQSVQSLDGELDIALELIGSFSPVSLKDEIISGLNVERVRFHDWMVREKMMQIMMKARAGLVLFHPTPNHVFSQPNKMFEYMAVGLPVIASNFPLWRQIIEEAECGLLVDPSSPAAIAEAMEWVLEHPERAQEMGRKGRDAVMRKYNWTLEGEKLVDLYKHLLRS